uniref:SAM domain-containing protein SAMSN-1a isoform X2 n=1 Tax=Doryrhamphus excisus TaxID=161450 RepID=UPI0025ADB154|nr:SAM domain-containing protein SAMSN-1a isoform X2 [Doryrhamphus excisus]
MNLFCFSLEGSMDSLYEAVQTSSDGPPKPVPSRSSSRSCSPALLLDNDAKWRGSGRSISMDMAPRTGTHTHKKNRRTHVSKSASDNEALDHAVGNTAVWKPAKSPEDLVHISNNHNEEIKRTRHKVDAKAGKTHTAAKKRDKHSPSQNTKGVATESKPAAKKTQKPGKKPPGKSGKDGTKKNSTVRSPPRTTSPPVGPQYLDVPHRSDTRLYLGKSSTLPTQENTSPGRCPDMISLPGGATPTHTYHHHHYTHNQRWSNPGDNSPAWGTVVQHTCRRPLTEYRACSHDFSQPHTKAEWQGGQEHDGGLDTNCKPPIPPKVTRSITEVDLAKPNRSTSFGKFEGLKHNPTAAKADNGTNLLPEECESSEPHKSAGIGKKMKAISLTMRRKMGKKHAKSFSEEMGDNTETDTGCTAEKNSAKTSNSLESLYSGQSSSSGVTTESNGSGQRDSLRLEEDGSYQGQFCGRARVHTDFVPSPYDTDSLKLKAGDIINIISKPPMGIWTGLLNNKVGNFKFIYVDVLVEKEEKEEEEETPKIRQQKMCKRPRPKTLLELLERLNLEEYASALLLNGYQTVEDLMHLQEKHLIELNVKDPEHRHKLLAAAQCHYPEGDDGRDVEESVPSSVPQEEDSDCPRDSGCFIPSECSDSKEDAEQLADDAAS